MSERFHPAPLRKLLTITIAALAVVLAAGSAQAATVSENVFLRGDFIELGIAPNGCLGSTVAAPTGYHSTEDNGYLGMVVDFQQEGWRSGTPEHSGDFVMPGANYESWGVQWEYDDSEHNYGCRRGDDDLIFSPSYLIETSTGNTQSARWISTIDSVPAGISIQQEFSFGVDDDYVLVTVTIQNTGSVTLENFSYMRGINPDQEYDCCTSDFTRNKVLYQPGVGGNTDWAVVRATGLTHADMAVYLGTNDTRALVSANERSEDYDPDNVLDNYALGPNISDSSIQLAYNFGDLISGETLEFTFFYAFSADGYEDALKAIGKAQQLPDTGFAPGVVTALAAQPEAKAYNNYSNLWLEIPRVGIATDILGVPAANGEWDVNWLGQNAGWLEGSAFPTLAGNTVLTGHVWNASGYPGIFVNLKSLQYGDYIYLHYNGMLYTYEVRETGLVRQSQMEKVFQHEEYDWLTLLTCEDWNASTGQYDFRRMVRAVLVEVAAE